MGLFDPTRHTCSTCKHWWVIHLVAEDGLVKAPCTTDNQTLMPWKMYTGAHTCPRWTRDPGKK
jgi:hypothetical protein